MLKSLYAVTTSFLNSGFDFLYPGFYPYYI